MVDDLGIDGLVVGRVVVMSRRGVLEHGVVMWMLVVVVVSRLGLLIVVMEGEGLIVGRVLEGM